MPRIPFRPLCLALACTLVTLAAQAAAPVVQFDQGHGQRFVVEEKGDLHLSGLADVFREAGYEVRSSAGRIDPEALHGVDVLVTSGLFAPYGPDEIQAILTFVEGGGGLAVMLHVAPTYANLLQALGVLASQGVLSEGQNVIDGKAQNFRITSFLDHPLTAGLDHLSVYGGWAVMDGGRDEKVRTVAFTSRTSWIDADRNRQRGPQEVLHSYGVLVAGDRGRGRFAVFGDDAIFQNRFLDDTNRKLAANLANWLGGR